MESDGHGIYTVRISRFTVFYDIVGSFNAESKDMLKIGIGIEFVDPAHSRFGVIALYRDAAAELIDRCRRQKILAYLYTRYRIVDQLLFRDLYADLRYLDR